MAIKNFPPNIILQSDIATHDLIILELCYIEDNQTPIYTYTRIRGGVYKEELFGKTEDGDDVVCRYIVGGMFVTRMKWGKDSLGNSIYLESLSPNKKYNF